MRTDPRAQLLLRSTRNVPLLLLETSFTCPNNLESEL
jgi:hypothetical protein